MYIEKRSGLRTCAYYGSKNSLAVLNVIYIFLAILLISIAVYAKITAVLTSLPILGAVVTCGVFLLIISIFGLIGAVRHQLVILFFLMKHFVLLLYQVALTLQPSYLTSGEDRSTGKLIMHYVYMITLAFLFIFLLSVSIAALTVSPAKQEQLLRSSWQRLGNQTKAELQVAGNCCGFHVLAELTNTSMSHPPCTKLPCCKKKNHNYCDQCPACFTYFKDSIDQVLSVAGGVGLFFSFTLIFGIYVAYKYRNVKDPSGLSGSFL